MFCEHCGEIPGPGPLISRPLPDAPVKQDERARLRWPELARQRKRLSGEAEPALPVLSLQTRPRSPDSPTVPVSADQIRPEEFHRGPGTGS